MVAILTRGGKIISVGYNRQRPVPARNVHAERDAICKGSEGAVLYVCRVKGYRNQTLAMARPCENCIKLIRKSKISKVCYTNEFGVWEEMKIV